MAVTVQSDPMNCGTNAPNWLFQYTVAGILQCRRCDQSTTLIVLYSARAASAVLSLCTQKERVQWQSALATAVVSRLGTSRECNGSALDLTRALHVSLGAQCSPCVREVSTLALAMGRFNDGHSFNPCCIGACVRACAPRVRHAVHQPPTWAGLSGPP